MWTNTHLKYAALLAIVLLAGFAICYAGESKVSTSVYYQVTYTNKDIRDLPAPPATNKGILMVTKITTYRSSLPGYTSIGTGGAAVEEVNPTRTVMTTMKWDGQKWVDAIPPAAIPRGIGSRSKSNISEKQLKQMARLLLQLGERLDQVDGQLNNIADPKAPDKIRESVTSARTSQRKAVEILAKIILRTNQPQTTVSTPAAGYNTIRVGNWENYWHQQYAPTANTDIWVSGWALYNWKGWSDRWPFFGGVRLSIPNDSRPHYIGPRVKIREKY